MPSAFRTLTLAAALAGLAPLAAQAIPVTINFDSLTNGNQVGSSAGNGLTFGANAIVAALPGPLVTAPSSPNGVQSVAAGYTINIGPTTTFNYVGLSLQYYITSQLTVTAFSGANGTGTQLAQVATTTFGQNSPWATLTLSQPGTTAFGSVTLVGNGSTTFYIDNLQLTQGSTGSSGAPEPASIALVALALAGAGAATRRRPKA